MTASELIDVLKLANPSLQVLVPSGSGQEVFSLPVVILRPSIAGKGAGLFFAEFDCLPEPGDCVLYAPPGWVRPVC